MKVRVIKKFRDRHTGVRHNVGTVIDITEERFAEIQSVDNLVEKLPDFESMSVAELRKYADEKYKLGFGRDMKKKAIIEELRRFEENGK